MRTKRSHEGYLLIDHRDSPGVPAHMVAAAKAAGKPVIDGGHGLYETGVLTCAHCQTVVLVNPLRARERGWCQKCDHYICDSPGCNAGCRPIRQIMELGREQAIRDLDRGNPASTNALIAQLRRDLL